MIKLLILCDKNILDRRMCRGRYHGMDAIARHPEMEVIKDGPNFKGWGGVVRSVNKHKPDALFWYKPLMMKNFMFADDKVVKIVAFNEMWNRKASEDEIIATKSNIIICHHANDMLNYSPRLDTPNRKFVNISHCSEKTVFKDYNLPKEYDVLLIGVRGKTIYPLRDKLYEAVQKIPNHKILEHPGYMIDNPEEQFIKYAKEINKAKIVVTCSSYFKYALAKYIEVPMCNTFLVADIPHERQDFFREFIGEIDESSNIVNTINYWLENDELRREKARRGHELVMEHYTQEHYAERFVSVLKDYLQKT